MGIFDSLLSSDSHDSIFSGLAMKGQKFTDPLTWIPGFGDKYSTFVSKTIPDKTNMVLSKVMAPFDKIDQTINPVRKIPIVDKVSNAVAARPGDAIGEALGAFYGGGTLLGAAGLGGAGAAGASGAGAAGAGTVAGGSAVPAAGFGGSTALGVAPTGLFSGLSPAAASTAGYGGTAFGGGLSGAAGGSALPIFSGAADGAGAVGGLGFNTGGTDYLSLIRQASSMNQQGQQQQQQQQNQQAQAAAAWQREVQRRGQQAAQGSINGFRY